MEGTRGGNGIVWSKCSHQDGKEHLFMQACRHDSRNLERDEPESVHETEKNDFIVQPGDEENPSECIMEAVTSISQPRNVLRNPEPRNVTKRIPTIGARNSTELSEVAPTEPDCRRTTTEE